MTARGLNAPLILGYFCAVNILFFKMLWGIGGLPLEKVGRQLLIMILLIFDRYLNTYTCLRGRQLKQCAKNVPTRKWSLSLTTTLLMVRK